MIFEIICILGMSGHYDCSWDLITMDPNSYFWPCGDAIACTQHHEKRIVMSPIAHELKDAWGQTVLWHEIRHAMCGCDWHDGGHRLYG